MQSEDKLCSPERNIVREEESDGKTKNENDLASIHFAIDATCIPTVLQCEQETELSGLDVKIYQQDVLEKEILDQVDRAFENHVREKTKESPVQCGKVDEQNESNGENVDGKKEKLQGLDIVLHEESEKEKKIRFGEMTPFGTEISLKTIEGNNLENIEQYLKKGIEISNETRGAKRKVSRTKTANKTFQFARDKNETLTTVKGTFRKKRKKSGEVRKIESDSNKWKSDCDNSSGSEYVPSASDDDSDDLDFESDSTFLKVKKRKRRKVADSNDDDDNDSEWESSRRKVNSRGDRDDGDEDDYLLRMERWEKENSREDIETRVHVLGDGFKVPSVVWNKLYNYQRVGVQWLWELNLQRCGGIVGDEMGLGKTIQIIAFLTGLSTSKLISPHGFFRGLGPVLIVCPTTVMHFWVKEFHQWWPQFRVALLHESGTYKGNKKDLIRDIVKRNGILITSYVTCIQQSNHLLRYTWHYVILDEGHKIRNPDSQITSTVKSFETPHRLILSGSPIQNNLKELWSLFDFIFPGKLGTLPVFLAEFGVPITQGGYANASKVQVATAYKCATVLRDIISPYLLRRLKEDVKTRINLPPKNEHVLFCKLTQEQKEMYKDYLNSGKVMEIINGKQKIFVGLIELRKICNHPHLYSGGPKLSKWGNSTTAEEEKYGHWKKAGKMIVLETLLKIWKKQGHRVLIFTQSRKMLAILENFISSRNYEYLKMDGLTAIGSRQPLINKFNENKKYYIFLSTTRVGGLGINLTGANRVVIYDPDWNPATDMQARERAWRIGQENQVTIYRFVSAGTIEEKIYHRQIFKQFLTIKVLKDPRQRRFFKSNDLYELFTFKDDDNTNETSAIFAGTGFELNGENLRRRKEREKLKGKFSLEPEKVKDVAESRCMLTKEKIEKMKRMAQALSRKIGMEISGEGKRKKDENSGTVSDDEKSPKVDESRKKAKKLAKRKTESFRGEFVPHLEKEKKYRDVMKEASDGRGDDDYILNKLFSKSGVQSALKHDEIMESGQDDYVLIEGEAEKIAKEAVKALKESRKNYARNLQSTAKTFSMPRFGRKSFRQQSSANLNTCNDSNKDKIMSSAELLLRIRQRNGIPAPNKSENSLDDNSELLTDIRNFISFGAENENVASTQEIVNKFRDRLPAGQTPLFKALLSEICDFHRTTRGEGIWELRSDFRW